MAFDTAFVLRHAVQTSSDFTTWATRAHMDAPSVTEGAGQIIGSATLVYKIGTIRQPGASGAPAAVTPITGMVGQYVRVLIEDLAGSVTIGSVNYATIWYGIVDAQSIEDMGTGMGIQTFVCSGLAAVLARLSMSQGFCEVTQANGFAGLSLPHRHPSFNDSENTSGAGIGTWEINGSAPFKIVTISTERLTAKDVIINILAAQGKWFDPADSTFVGDIDWALADNSLLGFACPTLDPNGMTPLDAINAIVNPRRGLTWRLTVSGTTATINAMSTSAVTIGDLPAATATVEPDLTEIFTDAVSIFTDEAAVFDRIDVVGGDVWTGMTLAYDPNNSNIYDNALVKGWTSTEETAWANGSGAVNDKVWRTFKLNPRWNGTTYDQGASGIGNALTLSGSDYTGARSTTGFDAADGIPSQYLKLTSTLPVAEGFPTAADTKSKRQDALSFAQLNATATWRDCNSERSFARSLHFEGRPFSVSFGDAHPSVSDLLQSQQVQNVAAIGGAASKLLVTCGVIEYNPIRVSWTRDPAEWPRGTPRTLSLWMPEAVLHRIAAGTVKGVTAGALVLVANEIIVRDDRAELTEALDFLRAYYSVPAVTVSWVRRGYIDYEYGTGHASPGVLVTAVDVGIGTVSVNAVVNRRVWTLTQDGYGTSYTTERVIPDIKSIK